MTTWLQISKKVIVCKCRQNNTKNNHLIFAFFFYNNTAFQRAIRKDTTRGKQCFTFVSLVFEANSLKKKKMYILTIRITSLMWQSNKYHPVSLLFREFKLTGAVWDCRLKKSAFRTACRIQNLLKMRSVFKRRRSNKAVTKHKMKVDSSLASCLNACLSWQYLLAKS